MSLPRRMEHAAPRTLTLLGATGTIGQNTLKILSTHPNRFALETITGGDNVDLLIAQARTHKPRRAVISNPAHYQALKDGLAGTGIETAAGEDAVLHEAGRKTDITLSAIVGIAGLKPTLAAIKNGGTIALANKECLVSAGALVMREVAKHNATLIPVDSEHNAIFQLLPPEKLPFVDTITLTASGGPFRSWNESQMQSVTPEQAVKHPNWAMGAKISVDSATLMNKGLELIEAYHLFPLHPSQFDILIHPQSIIHCLVAMKDGSVLAQLSHPDMCTPIACALAWPERIEAPVKKLNLADIAQLDFCAPDESRFPALRIAREALNAGGSACCVLNAANEIAVSRFLAGKIGFLDIAKTVEKTLQKVENTALETLSDVLACNDHARRIAETL